MSDGVKVAGWDYEAEHVKLLGEAYRGMPVANVGWERANALHLIAVASRLVGQAEQEEPQ